MLTPSGAVDTTRRLLAKLATSVAFLDAAAVRTDLAHLLRMYPTECNELIAFGTRRRPSPIPLIYAATLTNVICEAMVITAADALAAHLTPTLRATLVERSLVVMTLRLACQTPPISCDTVGAFQSEIAAVVRTELAHPRYN